MVGRVHVADRQDSHGREDKVPTVTDGPQIAVAIVSWNQSDQLARALRSLEADALEGLADVWVVDNASTDGSAAMVRDEFPWVSIIASEENLGYGGAVNLVARRTGTPWIAPANQDIEARPGALSRLLALGAEHPEAGALAPRLVTPDGGTQHSVHPFPTVWLTALFALGLPTASARLGDRLCIEGHWNPERAREVDWALGAFLLVRREAWDAIGGFDDAQWMYAEDLDLGWKLRRAGWRTRFAPDAEVLHLGGTAARKAFEGEDLTRRFMAASYAWMARRRSLPVARTVAAINFVAVSMRWAGYAALAAVAPRRFSEPRDSYRRWVGVHAVGLGRRDALMRHR
jgi:GT2 family glycosyltransferase